MMREAARVGVKTAVALRRRRSIEAHEPKMKKAMAQITGSSQMGELQEIEAKRRRRMKQRAKGKILAT